MASQLSSSESNTSISSLAANGNAPHCHICQEEVDVIQDAKCQCIDCNMYLCARDAKVHRKKEPTHQVVDLLGASTASLTGSGALQQSLSSSLTQILTSPRQTSTTIGGPSPTCTIHLIPINTYCKTCEKLVCSACAIEEHREGHEVNLISKVEPEERSRLEKILQDLRDSLTTWEDDHDTKDDSLGNESNLIEVERNRLKDEVKQVMDGLRKNLEEREKKLNQDIDEVCQVQTEMVRKVIELKKISVEYISEFDRLAEMSGYEMMERKLSKLRQTLQAFEDLKNFFKYQTLSEVHDFLVTNVEQPISSIQTEVNRLGQIVKTPPKPKVVKQVPQPAVTNATTATTETQPTPVTEQPPTPRSQSAPFKAFSTQFQLLATLGRSGKDGSGNDQFKSPSDVKISQNSNCIIVSDSNNSRIQFFDLKTREHKVTLKTAKNPRNLCIEANHEGQLKSDALIFSCENHCVYKYSVKRILAGEKPDPLWISGVPKKKGNDLTQFNDPSGLVVSYSKKLNDCFNEKGTEGNVIFVCDRENHRIKALRASDGKALKAFGGKSDKDIQLNLPECIDLDDSDNLIISEYGGNRIHFVTKAGDSEEMASLKVVGKEGQFNLDFNCPCGVLVDKTAQNLIICDSKNNRLQVYNLEHSEFRAVHGSDAKDSVFSRPVAACMNELTGELYVVDSTAHRVQIFK